MASLDDKSRKPRKHNFSSSEVAVLMEMVEQNLATLQSKLTNSVTNQKKKAIWQKITDAVNAVGVDKRDVKEVREKWKSLHSTAKREFGTYKREANKTGGGPQPKPVSSATEKLIELFQDTPQFAGLNGVETNGESIASRNYGLSLSFAYSRFLVH